MRLAVTSRWLEMKRMTIKIIMIAAVFAVRFMMAMTSVDALTFAPQPMISGKEMVTGKSPTGKEMNE